MHRVVRSPARLWQLGACFLAGNLAVHSLPVLPGAVSQLALVAAAVVGLLRLGSALPAAFVAGFIWTSLVAGHGLAARWSVAMDRADVELVGWIDTMPQHGAERVVFSLRVVDASMVAAEDADGSLAAAGAAVPRRVRLSWYAPAPPLQAGQSLRLTARLRAPRGSVNAAGFDYERWLFTENLDATGYVREGRLDDTNFSLAQRWLRLRAELAAGIRSRIGDADAAALLLALGLGERGGFDDRHWEVLQRTGTSHLVAVSGLHIGLIAAFSFWVCLRLVLWLPACWALHAHRLAALFCIFPAAGYAALAGFSLPTQRALVMIVIAQLLVVLRRSLLAWNALSLAVLAVLVPDPLASLSASFWLSFGAVALLFVLAGQGQARRDSASRPAILNGVKQLAVLQWSLSLGLAPLVAWFFSQVSVASFFVNLLAIPVFSLVIVPLSLLLVTGLLSGLSFEPVVRVAEFAAALAWDGLEFAAGSPAAAFSLPQPSWLTFILAMLAVVVFIARVRLPARSLAITGLLPLLLAARVSPAPAEARVEVLDVGHGLAVIIRTASHALLYDAGPVFRSGFDSGAETVVPALENLGIERLDLIVISHADNDHAGGVAAVRERYPEAVLLGGPDVSDAGAIGCRVGQHWVWDGIGFAVLHPPDGFSPPGNETSCVLKMLTPAGSLLVTGDIEQKAEAWLTAATDLSADVVIVPHHGSLTSSSPALVAAVDASIAIASADFNNRWGFPRAEVVSRWEAGGAFFTSTGAAGAMAICFCAQQVTILSQREANRRYWTATSVSGADDQSAL